MEIKWKKMFRGEKKMDEEELEIAEVRRKWGEIRRTEEVLSEWDDSPLVRGALWVVKGLLAMWVITILIWIAGTWVWLW